MGTSDEIERARINRQITRDWFRLSSTLIWQLLTAIALILAFRLLMVKLPAPPHPPAGPAPGGTTSTEPRETTGWATDDLREAQRQAAFAAINAWLKQNAKNDGDRAEESKVKQKLLDLVIKPLAEKGLFPLDVGKEVLNRIAAKGGWLEGVTKYGGDLLKDYLHQRWAKQLGADDCKGGKGTPSVYAPINVNSAPTFTAPAAPLPQIQTRYVYRYIYRRDSTSTQTVSPPRPPAPKAPVCPLTAAPQAPICTGPASPAQ